MIERIVIHFLQKIATRLETSLSEVSFNLDNQPVKMPGKTRTKVVKRTVYRTDIDDSKVDDGGGEQLTGSILIKGEWNRVVFDEKARYWRIRNA